MLKAQELRIGNIVQNVYQDTFGISQETLCDFANGYVNLKPILLTDEWLKSFGFKLYGESDYPNSPSDWYWCKIGFDFSISYKNKKVQHISNKVKYVHQLQNLYFALMGVELELSSNVA